MVRVRGGEVKPSWALSFFQSGDEVRGGEVKPGWVLAFFKVVGEPLRRGFRLDGSSARFLARRLFGAVFDSMGFRRGFWRGFRLDGSSARLSTRRLFGAVFDSMALRRGFWRGFQCGGVRERFSARFSAWLCVGVALLRGVKS